MTASEHWAVYFRYLTDKTKRQKINEIVQCEEGIAMASEVLISISRDEVERARLMSELKYELDTQSKLVHARREGRQEGRREGRQEGQKEARREIIELLKSGKAPEEIIREYDE
jgi:predicted transposase YdaD